MLREMTFKFTPEQIGEYAKYNVRWFTLAGLTYCRDQELSPQAYWNYFGDKFAANWQDLRTIEDIVFVICGNLLSFGMELISVEGDEGHCDITVGGIPTDDELEYFDLHRSDVDAVWKIFEPIMDSLGYDFSWDRSGDRVTFSITRRWQTREGI